MNYAISPAINKEQFNMYNKNLVKVYYLHSLKFSLDFIYKSI